MFNSDSLPALTRRSALTTALVSAVSVALNPIAHAATTSCSESASGSMSVGTENYPPGVDQHTGKAGDLTLSYLQAGTGEPLVLLHGFPQHSHMWLRMIPHLATRFQVIAPDQKGIGGSTVTNGGYDKRTLAEDIYRLLHDSLGYKRISLAGYDQGAGTAYALTAAHPEFVNKLAIAEFTFPGFGYEEFMAPKRGADDSWQLRAFLSPDLAERFISGRERDLLSWYFHIYCDKPSAVSMEDFEIYVRALQRPGVLRAGMSYFAAVWDDADHNRANVQKSKLTLPVLYVGGEKGVGIYGAQSTRQLASNVRELILKASGHWPADEQPREFADALLAFFTA